MLVNEKKGLLFTSGFIQWRCFAIQKQLKATGSCDQNWSDHSFKNLTWSAAGCDSNTYFSLWSCYRTYCNTDEHPEHRYLSQIEAIKLYLSGHEPHLYC